MGVHAPVVQPGLRGRLHRHPSVHLQCTVLAVVRRNATHFVSLLQKPLCLLHEQQQSRISWYKLRCLDSLGIEEVLIYHQELSALLSWSLRWSVQAGVCTWQDFHM